MTWGSPDGLSAWLVTHYTNQHSRTQDFRENTSVFRVYSALGLQPSQLTAAPLSLFLPRLSGEVRKGKRDRAGQTPERSRRKPQKAQRNRVVPRHSDHSEEDQVGSFANS